MMPLCAAQDSVASLAKATPFNLWHCAGTTITVFLIYY
jgi:hypothetical protein